MAKPQPSVAVRFWSHVEHGPGCWMWRANVHNGYGILKCNNVARRAHRLAWEITHGPIPPGMVVMHSCDVKGCVRPDHLCLGTQAENNADRARKGRSRPLLGELNPATTLLDAQVRTVRLMYANGVRRRDIARITGLPAGTVKRLKTGATFKHIVVPS